MKKKTFFDPQKKKIFIWAQTTHSIPNYVLNLYLIFFGCYYIFKWGIQYCHLSVQTLFFFFPFNLNMLISHYITYINCSFKIQIMQPYAYKIQADRQIELIRYNILISITSFVPFKGIQIKVCGTLSFTIHSCGLLIWLVKK